ncbi:MAG: hypothetical protein AAB225_10410 [Acidobacteriota bacterium]
MTGPSVLLLLPTVAMLVLHAVEWLAVRRGRMTARGLSAALAFESAYYSLLVAFPSGLNQWLVGSLAAAHWIALGQTSHGLPGRRVLLGVAVFDAAESVVLLYILWRLAAVSFW